MAYRAVKIDGKKLKREFEKRDVTLSTASETCGFEASYFSRACRVNKVGQPAINLLSTYYHIPYDSYKAVEEVKVEEKKKPETNFIINEEVGKELYKIIYSAVYEAVKKAWAE